MQFEICSFDRISLKNKLPVALSLMSLYRPPRICTVSRSVQGLITLKDREEKYLMQRSKHFHLFSKGMIFMNNLIQITYTEK